MIPHRRMKQQNKGERGRYDFFKKCFISRHNDVDVHINSNPPPRKFIYGIEKIKNKIYNYTLLKSKYEKYSLNTLTQMH